MRARLEDLRGAPEILGGGHSTGRTCLIAVELGASVLHAPKGRAAQMNAGARLAHGSLAAIEAAPARL